MGSALLSSHSQCALFVSNPHVIASPTSSSVHFAFPDVSTSVSPKEFSRGGYGLSQRSTLWSECGSLHIQNGRKIDLCSFSSARISLCHQSSGHCLKVKCSQTHGGVSGASDGSSCRDSAESSLGTSEQALQRRELIGGISSCIVLSGVMNSGSASGAAAAEEVDQILQSVEPPVKTGTAAVEGFDQILETLETVVPPAQTGLIERLLERSKTNKVKNDQERLDSFYKRNYKDYFGFLKGTILNKEEGDRTEAEKGILAWLEKNK